MKKENLNSYELFYMELPQTDYLNDIEIQDEYEAPGDQSFLSDEEVRKIAGDSLDAHPQEPHSPPSDEENLFSNDEKSR
jgi:hypothetical protein